VRADALRYASRPDRPGQPFDVIYGISLFEHLNLNQAIQLARDCHTLLTTGGVLLAGSVTPGMPASEQILRAWLTEWELQYRDEASWREVLNQSGFDVEHLRFDYEPLRANMLITAERTT
jgi:hypothetical protein